MKSAFLYILIFVIILAIPLSGNHAVTVLSNDQWDRNNVIIDAGHGGVDGGAVSCTGVYESHINLEIAWKLNDLMHLLGIRTVMIREDDRSIYTDGKTIAAKKVSDIKERVRIVNSTPHALFISIHQNKFPVAKYAGAQVFYNQIPESKVLADQMQTALRENLSHANNRKIKKASGIYLMDHINCIGILIECGFLSNPMEEALLRDSNYQKKLAGVICTSISRYLNT